MTTSSSFEIARPVDYPVRHLEPRVSGALLAWLRHAGNVVCRVDQRNMEKGLRKVADHALSAGVILLAEQADVVAQADEPLKQALCVGGTSDQYIGVGEPEA